MTERIYYAFSSRAFNTHQSLRHEHLLGIDKRLSPAYTAILALFRFLRPVRAVLALPSLRIHLRSNSASLHQQPRDHPSTLHRSLLSGDDVSLDVLPLPSLGHLGEIVRVLRHLGVHRLVALRSAIAPLRLGVDREAHSHLSRQMGVDQATTLLGALLSVDGHSGLLVRHLQLHLFLSIMPEQLRSDVDALRGRMLVRRCRRPWLRNLSPQHAAKHRDYRVQSRVARASDVEEVSTASGDAVAEESKDDHSTDVDFGDVPVRHCALGSDELSSAVRMVVQVGH